MNATEITPLTPARMRELAPELAALHQAAFGESDASMARYREAVPEMSRCAGFRGVAAWSGERLAGFVIGYNTTAITTWFATAMRAVDATPVASWLPEAWYFADIAVHPDLQGRSIGTLLHDRIMATVTDRRCMLITFHGNHPAKRFYARLGWQEVIPDLLWAPGKPLTSLMEHVGQHR
jgi:ribosomal protein S18 acetylase RimI-like enzyme